MVEIGVGYAAKSAGGSAQGGVSGSASTASCSVSQLFSITGPSEELSAEIVLGSNDKVTGGNVEILYDTSSTTISCKGDSNGSFTFVIKGGSPPYEYKNGSGGWTSASGATVQLTGLSADTYNIRVRDAGKCVSGGQEGVTLSVTESGTTTDNVAVLISEPPEELSASLSGDQQEIDIQLRLQNTGSVLENNHLT